MSLWSGESQSGETPGRAQGAIPFVVRRVGSDSFKQLFKEGMALVETSAAYLDGPGRVEAKMLARPAALAYATESMRLTTRLMQIASWLLLRRAVNEGELTPAQAKSEKHRVRLLRQDLSCSPEILAQLPAEFVELCQQSLRLQSRVLHLEESMNAPQEAVAARESGPVQAQLSQLRAAFEAAPYRRA